MPRRGRGVIRRAPTPLGVDGEYVDPDVPGFVFISTPRENEFVIKGSTIAVTWDPVAKQWLDSKSGLVCTFQSTPGPRQLPKVRTLPELGSKKWQHFDLSMATFKKLGLLEQMNTIAELAASFEVTPIELFWENQPQERTGRFYRYHKFPLDPHHQTLVFGGGINKAEIDDDLIKLNLKRLITDRHNLLKQVSKTSVVEQVKAMQKFQANAMTTPFIATTTDGNYARQLFKEYPPTAKQKAVILVIEGPQSHAFDFEATFHSIKETGGGKAEWNWRTTAERAKDAQQAEFGLPDLYIPLRGVSRSGFRIVEVIELGVPSGSGVLDVLAHDGHLHVEHLSSSSHETREGKSEARDVTPEGPRKDPGVD